MMINLTDEQRANVLALIPESQPNWEDYDSISKSLGKDVVKALKIPGLKKLPQDGWRQPLYMIEDISAISVPSGYALFTVGHGEVSLHDAAVLVFREIYNQTVDGKSWLRENAGR